MKDLELKRLEITLKNLLYFIDDEAKQKKIIEKLHEYSKKLPDSKLIDHIENKVLKHKKGYFEVMDFLVIDITNTKKTKENLMVIQSLINELNNIISNEQRLFIDKMTDLSKWS